MTIELDSSVFTYFRVVQQVVYSSKRFQRRLAHALCCNAGTVHQCRTTIACDPQQTACECPILSLAPICQSSLFYTFGLLKDYMICLAGSRSDLIPVQAVQVSVEATGELAAQRYEYRQLKATWLHEDPTDKPLSNPWKNWRFPRL